MIASPISIHRDHGMILTAWTPIYVFLNPACIHVWFLELTSVWDISNIILYAHG